MYRVRGDKRLRRATLGTYPTLTLADARDQARADLRTATKGRDPASERKAELQVACASLFQDTSEGIIRDYKGSAERTTNIDSVTVTSKAGTDAASKAKKEVFTKKKKASASLVVRFNAEPTLL